MSLLTEYLNEILNWLRQNMSSSYQDSDIDGIFLPGLTHSEIEEQVQDLPFKLPDEVYELYQWKNGMYQPSYQTATFLLFPSMAVYPLQEAINTYYACRMVPTWNQFWFPIFYWEKGYYAATGSKKEEPVSPILDIFFQETEPIIISSSLTLMMQEVLWKYNNGVYYIDEYSGELTDEPR